jgi:hypothetical protein
MSYLLYIDPDEPDVVVILSELPAIVEFVMFVPLVMLVSGVLMFCAFTEFSPTNASIPTITARRGMIRTNCVLLVSS